MPGPVQTVSIPHEQSTRLTFREANAVQVCEIYARSFHRISNDLQDPILVMLGRVSRQEAFPRRGDVGVPYVRQDIDSASL